MRKTEKPKKRKKTEKSRSPAREAGDWRSGTQAVWPPQWLLPLSDNNTIKMILLTVADDEVHCIFFFFYGGGGGGGGGRRRGG